MLTSGEEELSLPSAEKIEIGPDPAQKELGTATDCTAPEIKKKKESWWDIIKFALITLAIIIPIRMYIAQPFIVSGSSMFPTFLNGEYLIIDELSYNFRAPARGDVIIFKFPLDTSKYFIKRIIGLPGETVTVANGKVYIKKDGTERVVLNEPYEPQPTYKNTVTELKDDQYFVMGDNRQVSFDSRYWGALDVEYIRGRALFRLFPPSLISYLPGFFNAYQVDQSSSSPTILN